MDDLCMHLEVRHEHLSHLRLVVKKCQLYRIYLNLEKCVFMVRQGKILGHIVSRNGISMDMDKIEVIVRLPIPRNIKEVQSFMGHCGYYRRFIYIYAIIAQPLYALIVNFEWNEECDTSFQKLKKVLVCAPILKAPELMKIFHAHVDANNLAIGCILAQPGVTNTWTFLYAMLVPLNTVEKNYTTTEREGLGMIYAMKKFGITYWQTSLHFL